MNFPKNMFAFILLLGFLTIADSKAYAACTAPDGEEGDVVYNVTHKTMQYCNGTAWWAMKSDGGGGGGGGSSAWGDLTGVPAGFADGVDDTGGLFLQDTDNDTQIQVEETADDDTIRFDTAGLERLQIQPDGDIVIDTNTLFVDAVNNEVGIGNITPATKLHVSGDLLLGTATTCGATQKGSLRLNATADGLQMCDGVGNWGNFTGASGLGATGDVVHGSYVGNGTNDRLINLGFEPDVVIIKGVPGTFGLQIVTFKGMNSFNEYRSWSPNGGTSGDNLVEIVTNGFTVDAGGNDSVPNFTGTTYRYVAIRFGIGNGSPKATALGFDPLVWPEAIRCQTDNSTDAILTLSGIEPTRIRYGAIVGGATNANKFFTAAGAHHSEDHLTGAPCFSGSLATICAAGRCIFGGGGSFSPADSARIIDADGDTQIQVQESADEDTIRFDTAGVERMTITAAGKILINSPINNPFEARTTNTTGAGVVGANDSVTGGNFGVYGRAESTTGYGLFGDATAISGVNFGVSGRTTSPAGFGGSFDNTANGVALRSGGSFQLTTAASALCTATQRGALRLNGTLDGLQMCNGAGTWLAYGSIGSGDNLGNHTITTNLLPNTTNTRDLGSTALRLKDGWFAGNVTVSGNIDSSIQFLGQPADTITAPSFSWTGDTNTGMFAPAADTIGFTTAGLERAQIQPDGDVAIDTNTLFVDAVNNRVGVKTISPAGNLTVQDAGGATENALQINGAAAVNREISFTTNNTLRWILGANNITESGANAGSNFYLNSYNDAGALIDTNLTIIRSSGNVGIDELAPSQRLHVNGNVLATAYLHSSDRRLKDDIKDINNPFDLLDAVHGKHYVWKKDGKGAYGVIAQDVEKVMPDAVATNPDTDMKSVEYDQLIAPMIEALKELRDKTDFQEAENKALKAEIETLKSQNQDIIKRLEALEGEK